MIETETPVFMTTGELAARWRLHRNSILRMVRRDSQLRAVQFGNKNRYRIEDVLRYERERTLKPSEAKR